MKKYLWVVYPIFVIVFLISSIYKVNVGREQFIDKLDKEVKEEKKSENEPLNEVSEPQENTIEPQETQNGAIEEQNEAIEHVEEQVSSSYTTRMTSYYPEEGETMTASGLGINNFQVNDKGWFTYNGKLVVATASNRLGYTSMRTYNLYEELILSIDGVEYEAIVLDVCGACQRYNRIDLFVSSVRYAKDTTINVRRR